MAEVDRWSDIKELGLELRIQESVRIDKVRIPGFNVLDSRLHSQFGEVPAGAIRWKAYPFARLRDVDLVSKCELMSALLKGRYKVREVILDTSYLAAAPIYDKDSHKVLCGSPDRRAMTVWRTSKRAT